VSVPEYGQSKKTSNRGGGLVAPFDCLSLALSALIIAIWWKISNVTVNPFDPTDIGAACQALGSDDKSIAEIGGNISH
jgi:hypothetical protein